MQQQMQTHFQGLIQLLAKNLYPEPGVYLRELIQNAHDAIQFRRGLDPELEGSIEIEASVKKGLLSFRDNGIGMDRSDIENFLSTIGASGTRQRTQELQSLSPDELVQTIGRFGIGFLSSFAAAARVEVTTRKLGSEVVLQWTSQGDGFYELTERSDIPFAVGTQIVLHLLPEKISHAEESFLRKLIRRYVDFLPFPISLVGRGVLNRMSAPWYEAEAQPPEETYKALERFIKERFGEHPLWVIPVSLKKPQVAGVLYITPNPTGGYQPPMVDIFQRRIGVRLEDTSLLPSWASFVRGLIDAPDFTPTAARDNIQQDSVYHEVRAQLDQLVRASLIHVQMTQPRAFREICLRHGGQLKSVALHDQEIFDALIEHIPFETSLGLLSLGEYLLTKESLEKTPLYLLSQQHPRALLELCQARGFLAVRCAHPLEEELISLFCARRPGLFEVVRPSQELEIMASAPEAARRLSGLVQRLSMVLRQRGLLHIKVEVRSFLPKHLESILLQSEAVEERKEKLKEMAQRLPARSLFGEIVQDSQEALEGHTATLYLNAECEAVGGLGGAPEHLLFGLYTVALLRAGGQLTKEQRALLIAQLREAMHAGKRP